MARPVAVLVHTARIVSNVDGTTSPASASYTPPANTLIYCIATAVRGGGAISALTLAHSGAEGLGCRVPHAVGRCVDPNDRFGQKRYLSGPVMEDNSRCSASLPVRRLMRFVSAVVSCA